MSMIYRVIVPGEHARTFEDEYEAASYVVNSEEYITNLAVDVDELLDECYGHIEVAGEEFWASSILQALDEDSYNDYVRQEQESMAENDLDGVASDIGILDADENVTFSGDITVTAIEVSDDEEEDNEDPPLIESEDEFGFIFK